MTAYVRVPLVDRRTRPVAELRQQPQLQPKENLQRWFVQLRAITQATFSRQACVTVGLVAVLVCSALTVVYASHLNRTLFIDLQKLQKQRDLYQIEWSQLLLEQSAWSALSRVEGLAASDLQMKVPDPQDVVMVK